MGSGRLYAAVAAGGFRRYATYRAATAAGVFTNTVFGLILVYTYLALWDEKPQLGGYDQAQAVTFVWLGQALLAALAIGGGGFEDELMDRIRTGDIAVDLYRPADLQLWWLAADAGGRCSSCWGAGGAVRVRVAVLPGGAAAGGVRVGCLPGGGGAGGAGELRAALSGGAVGVLADGRLGGAAHGVDRGAVLLGDAAAAERVPRCAGEVVRALPWSSLLQAPADVLLGEAAPLGTFVFQAAWRWRCWRWGGCAVGGDATVVVQGG